ncbi:MAG: DUF2141 domain-containing protein [Haliscomenobacter sp.]
MYNWLLIITLLRAGAFLSPTSPVPAPTAAGPLQVRITNLRNEKGSIALLLFKSSYGFPDKPQFAVANRRFSIGSDPVFSFDNIPAGRYALSVIHDENENTLLDTNIVGVPKEGYGFSGNPKALFGPPGFEVAAFTFTGAPREVSVRLIYW